MSNQNKNEKVKNTSHKAPKKSRKTTPLSSQKSKQPFSNPIKTILMWVIVSITIFLGLRLINSFENLREVSLTYTQFKFLLSEPNHGIIRAQILRKGLNQVILRGEVENASILTKITGGRHSSAGRIFSVNLPFLDSKILEFLDEKRLNYTIEYEKVNVGDVILSIAPWLILILFWVFMFRQMQAGQRGIFSFSKSRAKLHNIDRPQNTFADVAGVDEAKAELEEIIEFLRDPQKFNRLGGKIPKGVLLLGPPGTGKTLLARCVAGEAGVPFLSMSGSDFVEMFVGVGASRVRDLFDTAKKNSPCIIFIDEIDAVGRQRGAGLGGGHDEREQTLNQMLVEMDGFEINSGVILIAATNRPDVLDPALLRPGRFDRQIVVDIPDIKGREGILKVHTKNIPLAPDVDLYTIARGTPGFVGADLANLVNEAALMAARYSQQYVTMLDFEEAKDKVMMGVERKSMVLSEKERRLTAYHEAGHAICNLHCPNADPLHKVTIIPRGRALGITFSLPKEDRHTHSKEYFLDEICITMGGRVAEEIVFQTQTNGAYSDIKVATSRARKMVCDFGMTEELGPLSYGEKDEQIFLGRELNRHRDYSEKTAQLIDDLMHKIVHEQYQRAKNILIENRIELERLANALLEHELLNLDEVQKVIRGEILEAARKSRSLLQKRREVDKKADNSSEKPQLPPTNSNSESDVDKIKEIGKDNS